MITNSLKVFHRTLLSGLVVILCLLFLENLFNRQNAYKAMRRFIYTTGPMKQYHNVSRASTIPAATEEGTNEISEAAAVVLWWTPFIDEMEYTKNCGNSVCFFTGKRKYFQHEKLKVSWWKAEWMEWNLRFRLCCCRYKKLSLMFHRFCCFMEAI